VGARYSAPVQTGPGAHPAFSTMGTGCFPGIKRRRSGVDHPPPSNAEIKERVGLYFYSPPPGTSVACCRVNFTFNFTLFYFNSLSPELNSICYLLTLLAHRFLHVSRIRVIYTYIYIYMEHLFLMFLDHTQRRSTVGRTPLDE
jgi:hypothetical protein